MRWRSTTAWTLAVAATVMPATDGRAVDAESWRADSLARYLAGEIDGLAIGTRGEVVLGPVREDVWGPDTGIVWALSVDPRGDGVWAGLSDPARIVRLTAGGARVAWEGAAEDWVTALATTEDGTVLAGVSPSGRIVELDVDGTATETEIDGDYVWALTVDADGTPWAATGSPGAVYVRTDAGAWTPVLRTGDDLVRSLAPLPGGGVVAGTGREGRVYRLAEGTSAFALYDADEGEIVALSVGPDGEVLALAARAGPAPRTTRAGADATAPDAAEPTGEETPDDKATSNGGTRMTVTPTPGGASVRISAPAGPRGGSLYAISADGDVVSRWESDDEAPLALATGPEGRPWVGLAGSGRVVSVGEDGESRLELRIASDNVTAIARDGKGDAWIGGSGDARLVRVSAGRTVASGSFVSDPVDAGWVADWGRVHWTAEVPEGGAIGIDVRTGNVAEPDATWSPWDGIVATDGRGSAPLAVPPARWAQVRIHLGRESPPGPRIRALELTYRVRNRAPRVVVLEVEPPGVAWGRQNGGSPDRAAPLVVDDPVARRVAAEVGRRPRSAPIRKSYEPGVRTVRWTALDPDGDDLRFALEIRREGDSPWVPLAAGIEDEFHGWDARGFADGIYRVRLTADDGASNAPERARSARRVSEPFRIDNTPPRARVATSDEDGWTVRVDDPGGRVASLERGVAASDWTPVEPRDGVADDEVETFRVARASDGKTVRIRITDMSGNVTVVVLSDR